MQNDPRFTWTYGPHSKNTIFINDNSLPNPKERGIAGINCHQIGNEMAERLAKAWCRALDMLALLQGLLPIIGAEADMRDEACTPDEYSGPGLAARYYIEMREALNTISREIDLAHGREPLPDESETPEIEPQLCAHNLNAENCNYCKLSVRRLDLPSKKEI